jgi:hypothetical protein
LAGDLPARLTPAEGRRFGLSVGLAFLALAGLFWWRDLAIARGIAAALGGALLLAALVVPGSLGPVLRAWMGLAKAISRVTTPILLGIIYYLVITPIGLVLRLVGHRPLVRRERSGSFWVPPASGGRSDLERQF